MMISESIAILSIATVSAGGLSFETTLNWIQSKTYTYSNNNSKNIWDIHYLDSQLLVQVDTKEMQVRYICFAANKIP